MTTRFEGRKRQERALERGRRLGERAGLRGFCLVGKALLGPTMSALVGLGLGYEPRRLTR